MGALEDAQAAIDKIDSATNQQATALQGLADSLQETSDDIDKLVTAGQIPQQLADDLKAKADRLQEVSDSLDQHVAFSKAIAAKTPANASPITNPVPVDVPAELPPVA